MNCRVEQVTQELDHHIVDQKVDLENHNHFKKIVLILIIHFNKLT